MYKANFDPNQPRNPDGTWADTGAGEGSGIKVGDLPDRVIDSVELYSGPYHKGLNIYLRTGEPQLVQDYDVDTDEVTERPLDEALAEDHDLTVDAWLADLDAFTSSGEVMGEMTVWRGINSAGRMGKIVKDLKPGDVLVDKGYMSTSADLGAAGWFGDAVMEITLPVGTKVGKFVGRLENPEEEILLPRNTRLRFSGKEGDHYKFVVEQEKAEKANFDPNQPRAPDGTWSETGAGDARTRVARAVRDAIHTIRSRLPEQHRKLLESKGVTYRLVADLGTKYGGKPVRGTFETDNWIVGLVTGGNPTILLSRNPDADDPNESPEQVVAHETAHALDWATGYSFSAALGSVMREEISKLVPAHEQDSAAWREYTKPQELFAEFYPVVNLGTASARFPGLTKERIKQHMPKTYQGLVDAATSIGKANFNPGQPRAKDGKWTRTGSSSAPDDTNPEKARQLMTLIQRLSDLQGGRGPATLVSRHGKQYRFSKDSFKGSERTQGKCYTCAGRLALQRNDLTYVEGFISVHGVPIEHAWTVDKDGNVIDPTLKGGRGIEAYVGVPFKTEYLVDTIQRTGYWGLLDHRNRDIIDHDPDTYLAKANFDPSQPRAPDGRWTDTGGEAPSPRPTEWFYSMKRHHVKHDGRPINDRWKKGYAGTTQAMRINEELREKGDPKLLRESDQAIIKSVDSLIASSYTTQSRVVYRGVNSEIVESLEVGDTLDNAGFTSTSMDAAYALAMARHAVGRSGQAALIKIYVPAGSRVGAVFGTEAEIILPRNARLRFEGKGKHRVDDKRLDVYRFLYIPDESQMKTAEKAKDDDEEEEYDTGRVALIPAGNIG